MWMGRWSPVLFHFSLNWKELATLKLTLEHLLRDHSDDVRGSTLFCFTDNASSSPGLHRLVESIRLLELHLECML